MSTNIIITKSIKDAATEAVAELSKFEKAKQVKNVALSTLDLFPKTKTGKDTKAIKEAKAKAEAAYNEAYSEYRHKCEDFAIAFRLGVIETNRTHASLFSIDKVLAEHGFSRDWGLSEKCAETTVSIRQYNDGVKATGEGKQYDGRTKEHGQIHYLQPSEHVYVHKDGGADALHLVIRFYKNDYTYRISYFGYAPKLTAFGLAFFRNYCVYGMSAFDHNILEDLRVNFSSIGSEYGPEAVQRLGALCTLVKVAEALMAKAPFAETRNICVEFDANLMEAIANGDKVCIVRRTILKQGFDEKKGRFNVVMCGKDISELPLDAEHVIVAEVDLSVPHEHSEEEDSE